VTIGWSILPAACCPNRYIHSEGPNFWVHDFVAQPVGSWPYFYDVSCAAPGLYEFMAWANYGAHNCGVYSPTVRVPFLVSPVNKNLKVSLRRLPQTGKIEATVSYTFHPNRPHNINLAISSWRDDQGVLHTTGPHLASHTAQTDTGQWVHEFTPPSSAHWMQVRATAPRCNGISEAYGDVNCATCPVGDPVSVEDGAVTMEDNDPLPSMLRGTGLQRTYMSSEGAAGAFGRGWFTMFDRMLATAASAEGHAVTLSTEMNTLMTFTGPIGGPYVQAAPRADGNAATLKYNASLAIYELRRPGDTIVSRYNSSGRFVGWRDLATARTGTIAYDAAGLPSSVSDSWSGLTWTVTADPTSRRVTSIAISGTPTIVWDYAYDGTGNLQSVQLNGAAWRTYEYETTA